MGHNLPGSDEMTGNSGAESISADRGGGASSTGLPPESRFACLPGCGLCCSYRVQLTALDRRTLREYRSPDDASGAWQATEDGEPALRREAGFCLFFDAQQRCSVYQARPEHCRSYPYLWTNYVQSELDVDLSCPGLGQGEAVAATLLQRPTEDKARQIRRESAIQHIQGLLRAQRRYADPEVLALLGAHYLDGFAAGWPGKILRLYQVRPLLVNAETQDSLPRLRQGFSLQQGPVDALFADTQFLEQHFSRPQWNTRLDPAGGVEVYRLWVFQRAFRLEARDGSWRQEIPLSQIQPLPWLDGALAVRRAYLERWLRRLLLVRLANNMALANLLQGRHVASCYLEFVQEVDWRLALLAPVLARSAEKTEIDTAVARETVRASDGLLRAWCQSARLGLIGKLSSLRST